MMGDPRPLISVIIPFCNVESFLDEVISSVLAQTYDHWELILVDDGSTDSSSAIAMKYCNQAPARIRCVHHDGRVNKGSSAARNLGRQFSHGAYIAYLDSDDIWVPGKLAEQVELLNTFPDAGMIIGASRYWHSWTGRPDDAQHDLIVQVGGPQDTLIRPPRLAQLLYPLGPGAAPTTNSVLIRTDIVDKVGGWEDEFKGAFDDQAFLIKVYLETPVYISSRCWDWYRQRPGSVSQIELVAEHRQRHKARFFIWLEKYLRARGYRGSEEWRMLKEATWQPRLRRYRYPVLSRIVSVAQFTLAPLRRFAKSRRSTAHR
jgi:glycosyltransferase involved in cell wall biosynthesis